MVNELEPLDLVALDPYDKKNAEMMAILRPLQQQVKDQGLWAAHLGPELGGRGFGQVKLALLNEILGRSRWGAVGVRLPGARLGKRRDPRAVLGHRRAEGALPAAVARRRNHLLLFDDQPQGGSDPGMFVTAATRDGAGNGDWVINGRSGFPATPGTRRSSS